MEFSYLLHSNTSIHTIGFSGTAIGTEGLQSLKKALQTNTSLKYVWIMHCQNCSLRERGQLQMALQHDRGIIRWACQSFFFSCDSTPVMHCSSSFSICMSFHCRPSFLPSCATPSLRREHLTNLCYVFVVRRKEEKVGGHPLCGTWTMSILL
jgi:hypothetical protein